MSLSYITYYMHASRCTKIQGHLRLLILAQMVAILGQYVFNSNCSTRWHCFGMFHILKQHILEIGLGHGKCYE